MEAQILLFVQEHVRCAALDGWMRALSALGDAGAVWILITLLLLLFRQTRRVGMVCAAALLMGLLITNLTLKNIIHRVRPFDVIDTLKILIDRPTDFSFPSGHTTASFAAGWTVWRLLPHRYGAPMLALAALIAFSRLYLGVHYPTDILAGALIGIGVSSIAMHVAKSPEYLDRFSMK